MQMRLHANILIISAASALVACSSSTSDPVVTPSGTGGGVGTGGATGTNVTPGFGGSPPSATTSISAAGAQNCSNVEPCGGDVVGTWNVSSSCLNLSGTKDIAILGLGCPTVPVTGSLKTTGKLTVKADNRFTDETTTKGSITFPLAPSCLTASSVPVTCDRMGGIFSAIGWTATCIDTAGQCSCTGTADQNGGIAYISSSYAATNAAYSVSGNVLTMDDTQKYSYCVSGSTLTMTPQASALTGTVVLQRDGVAPGSGGAGGVGGVGGATASTTTTAPAVGGATGAGGATSTGSGSKSSTGGVTGSGGKSSTGGASGIGGKSGSSGGTTSAGGSSSVGGGTSTPSGTGPCDIYAAANTKCVAAHSTIRVLLSTYSGPLYQVKKADGTTKDIPINAAGFADSAVQDTFCTGSTCVITKLYDQSGNGNFLSAQTTDAEDPSVRPNPNSNGKNNTAASATAESLTVGGHKVYSLFQKAGQAYWRDGSKSGMPLGSSPQGIYMVTSGTHFNGGCCYDYGNGPLSRSVSGSATMDALYFGNSTQWGFGSGTGPWVMADMENGIYAKNGGGNNPDVLSLPHTYVTAVEKNNGTAEFTLRGANATTGQLATYHKGGLPPGYSPMKKQGAIVLGSGGDCCYSNNNASVGTFYEGAIVDGYPSDATEETIQANIVNAGYGK